MMITFIAGILFSGALIFTEVRCSGCDTITNSNMYCKSCTNHKTETGKLFNWLADQIIWFDVNIANLKNNSIVSRPSKDELIKIRRRVCHILNIVEDVEDVFEDIDESNDHKDEDIDDLILDTFSDDASLDSIPPRATPGILPIQTVRALSGKLNNLVDKWWRILERDDKLDNLLQSSSSTTSMT